MISPEKLTEELRRSVGDDEAIDVVALAAALGCKIAAPGPIGKNGTVEAELRPYRTQDRFRIRVDAVPRRGWGNMPQPMRAAVARHRFRFRVCHELGHTFFFDRKAKTGPRRACAWSAAEEIWCDRFARALLVPRVAAKRVPPTADGPFALQARFDVSLEVAARAFASAHRQLDVAIWFWPFGTSSDPSLLLRQWGSADVPSLRHWREAELVARAISTGYSEGDLPALTRPAKRSRGSANCDHERHQLIAVAKR